MTTSDGATPEPLVVTPTEHDIAALIDTMLSGFSHDPLYVWLYPDPDQRRSSIGATFELMVRRGLERGLVRCTEDRQAVSIWTPPETDLLSETDVEDWLRRLRTEAAGLVTRAVTAMTACAAHAPDQGHWVLHSVVVASGRQDRGLGSALLTSTLRDVDASGRPAYLESSNLRNVGAYRRLGFQVTGEVDIPDGPIMRPMLRPAAGTGRTQTASTEAASRTARRSRRPA